MNIKVYFISLSYISIQPRQGILPKESDRHILCLSLLHTAWSRTPVWSVNGSFSKVIVGDKTINFIFVSKRMDLLWLLSLVLPSGILENFDIDRSTVHSARVDLYLIENLIQHGYHAESTIQDFPLRDKSLYLHITRRRWLIKSSGQFISRDLSFIASGTRISSEFAAF